MSLTRWQVKIASLISAVGLGAITATGADVEWRSYGGNQYFQRYSPLDQIDRGNLKDLVIAWQRPSINSELKERFPDINPSNNLRSTPIMVNGILYASDGVGMVEAFDAVTGQAKWIQKPFPFQSGELATCRDCSGAPQRGVAYWRSGNDERIVAVRGEYLYAINAKTGEPLSDFGDRGKVFLRWWAPELLHYRGWNGPIVSNDVIVLGGNGGSPGVEGSSIVGDDGVTKEGYPENVRGFDVRTGHLLWTFHVLPEPGDPGNETWGKESWKTAGNMGNWGPMSVDEKLGYVYVPLSAPTNAFYGGHRPGDNLYSNCLVALNVKTGKLMWYFQMVHHDLWDYDNGSPAILGDIRVSGKVIRAVMQANKDGFIYVFDRESGKPVWPIEERSVPQSTVPGEATSPTQPFPTKPPPIDMQGIREDDLIDFTPELRKKALEIVSHYVLGPLFTPPSLITPDGKKGTLVVPSVFGSASWNTGAFDPGTGIYYAVSRREADVYGMQAPNDPLATIAYTVVNPDTGRYSLPRPPPLLSPWANPTAKSPDGLPILKPPYGQITAFDMNKGDKLWAVADGEDGLKNNPALKGLSLPPLGNAGIPAALVTKTLLFLGDASDANTGRHGVRGPAKFRAYDKLTGQILWEVPIPAGTTGAPITYQVGGKQYIVVAVGGKDYGSGWIAFTLKN